jgi:hypothetical protein
MSNRAPLLKVFSRAIVRGIWFLSERLPRSRAENNANLLGNLLRREGEVDPQTARWPPGAVIFSFALKTKHFATNYIPKEIGIYKHHFGRLSRGT